MRICLALVLLSLALFAACHRESEPAGPVRHYAMTGKIVSLDAKHQTATVDAAAIPHYMEAMTMEYPIKNKSEFSSLHVGEQISATLDVASDDTYTLKDVKPLK